MASSVFPAQASGSETWVPIYSSAPTGATLTVSGLSGYKKIRVSARNLYTPSNTTLLMQPNGDTVANISYFWDSGNGVSTTILNVYEIYTGGGANGHTFDLTFDFANIAGAVRFSGYIIEGSVYKNFNGLYTGSALSSFKILPGSGTFSGNNVPVYVLGIAA